MHEYDEALAGETMQGGPRMLSGSAGADGGLDSAEALNVVNHEFAHIIDMRDGFADGAPPLPIARARKQCLDVTGAEWGDVCE